MVVGIKILATLAGDDAARTAIPAAGRFDGVFLIVAALMLWQALLVIAENNPVAIVRKRPADLDQRERLPSFIRQFGNGNPIGCRIDATKVEGECASYRQTDDEQEAHPPLHADLALARFDLGFDLLTQTDVQFA